MWLGSVNLFWVQYVEVGMHLDAALQKVQTDGEIELGMDWGRVHERSLK